MDGRSFWESVPSRLLVPRQIRWKSKQVMSVQYACREGERREGVYKLIILYCAVEVGFTCKKVTHGPISSGYNTERDGCFKVILKVLV